MPTLIMPIELKSIVIEEQFVIIELNGDVHLDLSTRDKKSGAPKVF